MAAKSIGSLYIDIAARTGTMEADIAKIKAQVAGIGTAAASASDELDKSITDQGESWKKMGAIMAGVVAGGLLAAGAEAKHVADNIRSIPGVSKETIQSIDEMNYSLYEARRSLDQMVAKGLVGVSEFMQGWKYIGIGLSKGYDAAVDADVDTITNARAFALSGYRKELAAIDENIAAINEQSAAEQGLKNIRAERVDYLRQEASLLRDMAAGKALNPDIVSQHPKLIALKTQFDVTGMSENDSQQLNIQASQADLQAAQGMLRLYSSLHAAMDLNAKSATSLATAHMGLNAQLDLWLQKEGAAMMELQKGSDLMGAGQEGAGVQLQIQAYKDLANAEQHVADITKKMKQPLMEMEDAFKNGFGTLSTELTDFVNTGTFKLNDFLLTMSKDIEETFFKLAIVNPLLNAMFGGAGGVGGAALPSLLSLFGGHAAGGPVSGATMVGEMGPELFVPPGGGGTIIPNNKLGGGNVTTNIIDARGADPGQIQMLARQMKALNQSVEFRAVHAVVGARRRGGSKGSALS